MQITPTTLNATHTLSRVTSPAAPRLPEPVPAARSEDQVSISAEAQERFRTATEGQAPGTVSEATTSDPTDATSSEAASDDTTRQKAAPARQGQGSEAAAQQQIEVLRQRDREVRAHEQAHLAAAGGYATGGATFTFEVGPDGRRYAVGGEVPIDLSAVPNDPAATIRKAATIQRAALAPANPSGPDRAVAAQAAQTAAQAQQELLQAKFQEQTTATKASSQDQGNSATTTARRPEAG